MLGTSTCRGGEKEQRIRLRKGDNGMQPILEMKESSLGRWKRGRRRLKKGREDMMAKKKKGSKIGDLVRKGEG